jgi:hypothetical protein
MCKSTAAQEGEIRHRHSPSLPETIPRVVRKPQEVSVTPSPTSHGTTPESRSGTRTRSQLMSASRFYPSRCLTDEYLDAQPLASEGSTGFCIRDRKATDLVLSPHDRTRPVHFPSHLLLCNPQNRSTPLCFCSSTADRLE